MVTIGEGEGGRGKIGAVNKEVQTAMYKINVLIKATRICCTAQGILPIFDNYYK